MKTLNCTINTISVTFGNSVKATVVSEREFSEALIFNGRDEEIVFRSTGLPYQRYKKYLGILKEYKYDFPIGKTHSKIIDGIVFISFNLIFKNIINVLSNNIQPEFT